MATTVSLKTNNGIQHEFVQYGYYNGEGQLLSPAEAAKILRQVIDKKTVSRVIE